MYVYIHLNVAVASVNGKMCVREVENEGLTVSGSSRPFMTLNEVEI